MVFKPTQRQLPTPAPGGVWPTAAVANVGAVVGGLAGMEMSGYQVLSLLGAAQGADPAMTQRALLNQMQAGSIGTASDSEDVMSPAVIGGTSAEAPAYAEHNAPFSPTLHSFAGNPHTWQGLLPPQDSPNDGPTLQPLNAGQSVLDTSSSAQSVPWDGSTQQSASTAGLHNIAAASGEPPLGQSWDDNQPTLTAALNPTGVPAQSAPDAKGLLLYGSGDGSVTRGTDQNDTLIGSHGADTLIGTGGNDLYVVHSNLNHIVEDYLGGYDTVLLGVDDFLGTNQIEVVAVLPNGPAYLSHSAVPDLMAHSLDVGWHLNGGASDQTLIGGSQADILNGMGGADTLIGGAGNDVYYFGGTERIIERAQEGTDIVLATASIVLPEQVEVVVAKAQAGPVNLTGNGQDNLLIGNNDNNALSGGAGDDTLIGGGGEDSFLGGDGHDTFVLNAADGFMGEILDFHSGIDTLQFSYPLNGQTPALTFTEGDFSGVAGQVLLGTSMVQVDWDGDGIGDTLLLVNSAPLATDFSTLVLDPSHLPGI